MDTVDTPTHRPPRIGFTVRCCGRRGRQVVNFGIVIAGQSNAGGQGGAPGGDSYPVAVLSARDHCPLSSRIAWLTDRRISPWSTASALRASRADGRGRIGVPTAEASIRLMIDFDLKKFFAKPNTAHRLAGLNLRPDLAAAAVRMVCDERSDQQIVKLESEFDNEESVLIVVEGVNDQALGFLALTTARVLFRVHEAGPGKIASVPLVDISEVRDRARGRYGQVMLQLRAGMLQVDKIPGIGAAQFAQALRRQLTGPEQVLPRDPVQELLELRELRAVGGISDADYQAAKARLLEEL